MSAGQKAVEQGQAHGACRIAGNVNGWPVTKSTRIISSFVARRSYLPANSLQKPRAQRVVFDFKVKASLSVPKKP